MKLYNEDKINLINYFLIKNWKNPIIRNYKLNIKEIWCNAICPICTDWKYKEDKKNIIKNIYIVLDKIIKEKIKYKNIQILWWEPLLIFEDILKIIKIWKEEGIKFDFPTNASLLNIENIDRLIDVGLDNFTFSIDFPNENHDKWRNLKWSFNKITSFTNYIKSKSIKVQWNTVVWKFNLEEIFNFYDLYETSIPNIHNFILIEENWWESKNNFLDNKEIEKFNKIIKVIEDKNYKNFFIVKNWFDKDRNLKNKKEENDICYIPLKNINIKINEKWYRISPCYIDEEIKDINSFTYNAIINWCNKCNSSYKEWYNNYLSDLIKKYKSKK